MVLLGFRDEPLDSLSVSNVTENQIGGLPLWLNPPNEVPKCSLCSSPSLLVVQIYAPISGSSLDRVLYVFCCPEPPCQNQTEAWTVVRMTKTSCHVVFSKPPRDPCGVERKVVDWGVGGDDWGEDEDCDLFAGVMSSTASESTAVNGTGLEEEIGVNDTRSDHVTRDNVNEGDQLMTSLSNLSLRENKTCFIPYYMSVDVEGTFEAPCPEISSEVMDDSSGGGTEMYERSHIPHADRAFHKFYKRIRQEPQQCLRYDRDGPPLLHRPAPHDTVEPCGRCGAPRVFELQLMPAIISVLRLRGSRATCLDFRTVHVYTCSADCDVGVGLEMGVCVPEPEVVFSQSMPPKGS